MLCGASDTRDVEDQFMEVAKDLGAEPLHYLSGNILYENKVGSNFRTNSAETVREADLCVFTIIANYGEITWETELEEALSEGKPFLVLCLSRTWDEYLTLRTVDPGAINDVSKRNMVRVLQQLDSHRQLSVAPFTMGKYGEVFRHEAAKIFRRGLATLAERARREQLNILMRDRSRMTWHDVARAEEMALDEFEEKGRRKLAIEALAEREGLANPSAVLDLIASSEQGVQRLAMDHLAALYRQRPPDAGFLDQCVAAANHSDDTGIARRLIPALFQIDPSGAINAARGLKLTDIGVRHRLADLLVENEHLLEEASLRTIGVELLSRCVGAGDNVDWKRRASDCLKRLQNESQADEA